jgi:hypothetical protein
VLISVAVLFDMLYEEMVCGFDISLKIHGILLNERAWVREPQ